MIVLGPTRRDMFSNAEDDEDEDDEEGAEEMKSFIAYEEEEDENLGNRKEKQRFTLPDDSDEDDDDRTAIQGNRLWRLLELVDSAHPLLRGEARTKFLLFVSWNSLVPLRYLRIAQRLLDQLKCLKSEINQSHGAPDPTDGGHEQAAVWALDVDSLHTSIRRLLIKYCVPAPAVHWSLYGTAPDCGGMVNGDERAREPEGIWNLMAIAREMFVPGTRMRCLC
ncbi:hypothetical protein TELCIR_02176 [Teladorsagia circumcincta]|uniref:ZSWIM8 TPR repeats domain-containing protein n=1 Tax=Teladorsagia circumcincta TaxID=45464 RepID=A0A2G9UZV4_TELCI|nr:hypothetical protein TELCIR_02176 [Teladorsagia circumcincta]